MLFSDIDECRSSNGGCHHNCINLQGNFECSCRDGYMLENGGNVCQDINECLTGVRCDHICVNQEGRFLCECREGYQLNETDGRSCNG